MQHIIEKFPDEIVRKAAKIKAIITDVDGVLTDGGIIYDGGEAELKKFNVKDGQIIKPLRENGIIVAAITGRDSAVVKRRLKELNFDYHVHGKLDKLNYFDEILETFQLKEEEVCYLGDDLTDIACLLKAGLGVSPADALTYVAAEADFITSKNGGEGVLREVADLILAAQNKLEKILIQFKSQEV